ncbi:MAG: dihydrofolate reductase family protein [Trebonia sp.]
MRDVVVHAWTTLDGFSVDEGTEAIKAMEDADDPEFNQYFVRALGAAGTHIMGRVTYLEMAEYWPTSDEPIAAPMNAVPKVVFSATLKTSGWPESRIASGDTAEEIARLKREPGGEIIAHGGTQFVRSLTRFGLADRYRFYVVPYAAGEGVPLFTGDAHPGRLRLESSTAFPSGILELVYRPA